MLHRKGSSWSICPFKVRHTQHGEEIEKYGYNKQWWLDFEKRWEHTTINEFVVVEPTEGQLKRLEEVRNMPNDFGNVYSAYVGTDEIIGGVPENHPFNLIVLKKENEAQAQQATDNELQNMLQGQQLTDVELRLLTLEVGK